MKILKNDDFWFNRHFVLIFVAIFFLVYSTHEIAIHLTLTEEMAGEGGIIKHLFSRDSWEDWIRLTNLEFFFVLPIAFLISKKMLMLKEAHKKATILAKEKSKSEADIKNFAYSVAHDIKNPATSLCAFANRLHDFHAKNEKIDPSMELAYKQVAKLSKFIVHLSDDINTYMKTREYPIDPELVDFKKLVRTIQSEFSVQFQQKGVKFHLDEGLPVISVDRIAIDRVFRNLFDNALKYGGKKLSKIVVECDVNKNNHMILFHDDGDGMDGDEDGHENIFQMFTRSESSKGSEGTGLGLAIVKETLERHGGRVKVESVKEKGTTFFLYFPIEK